jgi:hypothetical protein
MSQPHPLAVQNFSRVCIGVSDIEASLAFYTAVRWAWTSCSTSSSKGPDWIR